MKLKGFFIIFEGLSLKSVKNFFLEGESPTLIKLYLIVYAARFPSHQDTSSDVIWSGADGLNDHKGVD